MGEVAVPPAAAAAVGLRPRVVVVVAVGGARADAVGLVAAVAMRLLPAAAEDVGTVPGTDMAASTSLQER
jgi:hypothetical protein